MMPENVFRLILPMAFVSMVCGCDRGPGPIVWTQHRLSNDQDVRQETLLSELHGPMNSGMRDCLDGVPTNQHAELLSLADATGVRGDERFYKFTVLMEGDVHEPTDMIFIVKNDVITFARWPFGEF